MTTVMAFGTFDRLHPGHAHYLKSAKRHGDRLIAVVARDATVERIKGKRPVHGQERRMESLQRLGIADDVVLGGTGDKLAVIDYFRPDVLCLGYDQHSFITDGLLKKLSARGMFPKIVRMGAYHPERFKSSLLLQTLLFSAVPLRF